MSPVHVIGDGFLYTVTKRESNNKIPTHFHMAVVILRSILPLKFWELLHSFPPACYREYYAYWTFFGSTWRILENWNSFKSSNLNYFLRANLGELTRSFDMQKYQQGGNIHAWDKLNNDWLVRDQYFICELGLWPNSSRQGKVALILFNIYFEIVLS